MASAKIPFAAISAGKLRRGLMSVRNLWLNARDIGRLMAGIGQAWQILGSFKPDIVFLKGGFVCLPVGLAAHMRRIPYIIHESDIHAGLTNRILARWATRIAVGFPVKHYHDFDPAKLVFTGNAVRAELLRAHRLEGLAAFHLDSKLPVILVTGGSQGARQVNDVVLAALPELLERYQVIHQVGEGDIARVKFELSRQKLSHNERYRPVAFLLAEMPAALAAADVLVARAGAQTIAEAAVLGKPTVLIPNYQAAAHQQENAKVLARAGAARVLDGAKLTPALLVGEVRRILDDPHEQQLLGQGIQAFGRPQAATDLAKLILSTSKPAQGGDHG